MAISLFVLSLQIFCCSFLVNALLQKNPYFLKNSFSSLPKRSFPNFVWGDLHCESINQRYSHDDITFRTRIGESIQTFIPQAERYSTRDWWHNLKTMKTSRLLRRISCVITFNTFWSFVVFLLHKVFAFNSPGSKAHALLGGALSLLLVFRTNSAYTRFWEGRKIWERLLSSLRDLGRASVIYADAMSEVQLARILHLLVAFPVVLQEHVQGFRQPEELKGLITDEEIEELESVTNRPFFVVNRLAKEVRRIPESSVFSAREKERMFKLVDELSKSISSCERIVQTPVPLAYARHTSRFLSLWCLTLPVCLVAEIGFHIVPFTALVTWALYGILDIGMMIEDPFQRALKLEVFGNTIRRDLSELLYVTNVSLYPLTIKSAKLKYEKPIYHPSAMTVGVPSARFSPSNSTNSPWSDSFAISR